MPPSRSRRRSLPCLVVLLLTVGLTACGSPSAPVEPASSPTSAAVARPEPGAGLVGLWKVTAPSEGDRTWARFTATGVDVNRDGLLLFASWSTAGDQLVADVTGFDGRLADVTAPWLTAAVSFARSGDGWTLRAADGSRVAELQPEGRPPQPRGAGTEQTVVPTLGPTDVAVRVPVPAPSASVSTTELEGRWTTGTAGPDETLPFIAFSADGRYRTSDGCNGTSGRWRLLAGGRLIATAGISSATACGNLVPVSSWIWATTSVSIEGGRLRLLDRDGRELGAFTR